MEDEEVGLPSAEDLDVAAREAETAQKTGAAETTKTTPGMDPGMGCRRHGIADCPLCSGDIALGTGWECY